MEIRLNLTSTRPRHWTPPFIRWYKRECLHDLAIVDEAINWSTIDHRRAENSKNPRAISHGLWQPLARGLGDVECWVFFVEGDGVIS